MRGLHDDTDVQTAHPASTAQTAMVTIPGPLQSFLRMAGISPEASPQDVLPLLARNVSLLGYTGGSETEYLVLLRRYMQFARDLRKLTDPQDTIHVDSCPDADRLMAILGYQFKGICGEKDAYLVTANAERAFLTVDSAFPLTRLEESMQNHTPFAYSFPASQVPALFREQDWVAASVWRHKGEAALVDVLLHDVELDRLYWALSKEDGETLAVLHRSRGLSSLMPIAAALEFYGSQISVRSGHIQVPGGPHADAAWEQLVGASPRSPGEFVVRLCERDDGWLAAFFDAISRVSREQQQRLSEGQRLRQLYDVYRRAGTGQNAMRGVFPRNGDLVVLLDGVRWQPDGAPYIPGSLGVWKEILSQDSVPKLMRDWVRNAHRWDSPEQLLMTLVACSNFPSESGPMQLYLTLSAIDRGRAPQDRLADGTVRLMAAKFSRYHSWYLAFSEFSALNDTSVTQFLQAADAVTAVAAPALRSNALGALQANIGLWEILARQQEIPETAMNTSWQAIVQPFIGVSSSAQLFDATRGSLQSMLKAAGGNPNLSQDQIIDLLAGPAQLTDAGRSAHDAIADRMRTVLNDQRLVSLDTLFGLYDGLDQLAHGAAVKDQLIPLAGELREFEMPRAIFTAGEKAEWAPEIYTSRHGELQVRTDLTRVIRSASSPAQLEAARADLTPFLRDTLVGLNYAYYEPPGAQILHNNPLYVRSHDFGAGSITGYNQIWDPPSLVGIGVTAGGGAYLIGSLADLPLALASAEDNFIAPEHAGALMWEGAAPALLVDAVQPRWWSISPTELHAAALYQRTGEELLLAAPGNPELRDRISDILADVMAPRRLEATERALADSADTAALMPRIMPAEEFYLAAQYRRLYPADAPASGPVGRELDGVAHSNPADVSAERLSRDFGVPHPTLEQTSACAILNVKPLPAYSGEVFALVGESWQSSNLYWARLADEMGYSPASLNVLVPELSRRMIAKIFATDLDDWPAILRAMEQTGDEFRQGGIRIASSTTISQH
jgi:hypothetical protein